MSYLNLVGCEVQTCPESEVGVMHSFKLQYKRGKREIHYFYCSDTEALQDWISSLKKIIDINLQLDVLTAMMMGGGNTFGQMQAEND